MVSDVFRLRVEVDAADEENARLRGVEQLRGNRDFR